MTFRVATAHTAQQPQDRWVTMALPESLLQGVRSGYRYRAPNGSTFVIGDPVGSGNTRLAHLHRIFQKWENQELVIDPSIELGPCRTCPGDTPTRILVTGTIDGVAVAHEITLTSTVHSDAILKVWKIRERILNVQAQQTKCTAEGYLYQWGNHPIMTCELTFVASNPAVDSLRADVTDLRVVFLDADAVFPRWKSYQQISNGTAMNDAMLIAGSDYIADGQATTGYVFDIVDMRPGTDPINLLGVTEGPAYAMLHPDDWEGHLFMQGGMPDLLPADQADGGVSAINALIAFWGSEKARNNRWDPPDRIGGLWRQPGAPSERADYGSGHPASLLSAGQLSAWAIDMNLAASMREWIRAASHYRESNAEIVDWDDHPLAHAHGEKRHGGTAYNGGGQPGGPDLFGQSHLDMPEYQDAHDIGARNYEHWTSNQLLATACVTGSFLLYDRLREISRAFARAFTGYYTGWQTEGWGIFQQLISVGHRAEGRSRKSVSRAYWLTGETQVRDALWQRLRSCAGEQDLYSQTWGDIFKYQILRATPYEMFTLNLQNPASGYFDDPSLGIASADRWSWIPWQVGLAIEGLHDTLLATGDPTYETPLGVLEQPLHYILTRLCETFVRYGWVWNSVAEEYFMPKAIRWAAPNGDREGLDMPVDHSLYQPGVANNLQPWIQDSRDTAYAEWNWAGLKVALEHYLTQDSDRVKAQAIDAQLKAAFEASTDFGLARYNNGDPYFPVGARYGVSSTGQLGNA
jgi:hypothetical protein